MWMHVSADFARSHGTPTVFISQKVCVALCLSQNLESKNLATCLTFYFPCPLGVYLDQCCVRNKKPMLEGGTLGSKGHTLVVVPHLTESYGPSTSGGQKAIPICTLKNFPHRIEHTLQVRRHTFFCLADWQVVALTANDHFSHFAVTNTFVGSIFRS